MPESKLVRVAFFVSPLYWDEFTNIDSYKSDDEKLVSAIKPDDLKDTLPAWLGDNSIIEQERSRTRESISGSYRFMGENGVYCEIFQKKVHGDKPQRNFVLGEYGDYRRAVRVLAMPHSRGLPSELASALASRGYTESERKSREIRVLLQS